MSMRVRLVWLAGCLLPLMALAPAAADSDSTTADEQMLQAAGLRTDGAALLDFLRQRSQPVPDRARLQALAQQLVGSSRNERDRAAAELLAIGPPALPALRRAVQDPDEREV